MLVAGTDDRDVKLALADEALSPKLDERRQALRPGEGEDGRAPLLIDDQYDRLQAFGFDGGASTRAAIICRSMSEPGGTMVICAPLSSTRWTSRISNMA